MSTPTRTTAGCRADILRINCMQYSTPTLNGVFSVLRSATKYGKLLANGRNGSYLESSCATNLHFTPHVMLTSNKSAIQRLPSSATQSCLVNYSTDNIPCPISLALILMLPLITVSQVRVRTGQGRDPIARRVDYPSL